MKRIIKLSSLVLAVLLMLTACSAVFDSAISGTVKDRSVRETSSSSSGGIADVMVYAYDNEADWTAKYDSWDGKSEFTDTTVPSAKTASDGSFSISNLRWYTTSPVYGKDADCKTIYLLAFSKDYGLVKVPGRTIQSDKSNNFGIVYMDKVTVTKTLVIKLKDSDESSSTSTGTDSSITSASGISFRYKYSDYYDGENQNVMATVDSFTNGQASITIKYKETYIDEDGKTQKYAVPEVTLYDIQTGSDWRLTDSTITAISCTYDEDAAEYKNTNIYLTSKWQTVSVTVSLIDGSSTNASSSVTDQIDFKWSYDNGEEKKSSTVTTTAASSTYTINVKYRKTVDGKAYAPTLTLYDFKDHDTDDPKWTWTTSKDDARKASSAITVKLTDSSGSALDSVTQKVYFRKNYITLPASGISGYLITKESDETGKTAATGYGYTCDYGDELFLYTGTVDEGSTPVNDNAVRTTKVISDTSSNEPVIDYGYFTGLGSGVKLQLTYGDESSSSTGVLSYKGEAVKLTVQYILRNSSDSEQTSAGTLQYYSTTTDFTVMLYKTAPTTT